MSARRIFWIGIVVLGLLLPICGESLAAEKKFPAKPIQVIIPFQPGDTDNLLRPFIEKMPEFLGQPVNLIYKPGAAGSVGAGFVAASKPDGYTLVGSSYSSILTVPLTHKDVGYTWESFAPVSCLVEAASLLVVLPSAPWKDLKELVAANKTSNLLEDFMRRDSRKVPTKASGAFLMPLEALKAIQRQDVMK